MTYMINATNFVMELIIDSLCSIILLISITIDSALCGMTMIEICRYWSTKTRGRKTQICGKKWSQLQMCHTQTSMLVWEKTCKVNK